MDHAELIQKLMATFLEEMQEHVSALNQELLALESSGAGDERGKCLKRLFRTAHSLKGAARSVSVPLIETACHGLEEILAAAGEDRLQLQHEHFALLFAVADAIEEAGMRLREQQDLAEAPLANLLPQLDAVTASLSARPARGAERMPRPPAPPKPKPAPAPPTVVNQEPDPVPATPAPTTILPELPSGPSSVRIAAEKLDTILDRSGELLVARRQVEARAAEILALRDFVEDWERDWHRGERGIEQVFHDDQGDGANPSLPAGSLRRTGRLVRQTGQRLRRLKKEVDRLAGATTADSRFLEQVAAPLDEEVRRVRMLPFAEACAGLERLARDVARTVGKEVDLVIKGGAVEIDRSILEGLKDPLRHLVRNAIDHGVEMPEKRRLLGKPQRGRIEVNAVLRGSQVEVSIHDDGGGLDLAALREQARRRRLAEPVEDRDVAGLIFVPGFSTSTIVTDVSGRGVGLDVVKSRVEALHGTVEVDFRPDGGTQFTLTLPLTLTTLRAVLVKAGGQTLAIAGTNVHKLARIDLSELRMVAGRETIMMGGELLPYADLAATLQLFGGDDGLAHSEELGPRSKAKTPAIVIAAGEKRMAFGVEAFLSEHEILIKGMGPRLRHVPLVAGATLLPSGRIAIVLNAANVLRHAFGQASVRLAAPAEPTRAARKRLLLAEDSLTTRTLEKTILEAAGYEVATAVDGLAAWEFLQDAEIDLIVSDVEMPRMNGFELTEAVRGSKRFQSVPVILVTSRDTDQDKARGIEVGADAYLVKSAFDQSSLLETIAQLL